MQISVTVTLAEGDHLERTADEVAVDVLQAFGADPATDYIVVSVMAPAVTASFGTLPGSVAIAPEGMREP